jgi:pimeloyl-ACP methyl ester carboxylesterase
MTDIFAGLICRPPRKQYKIDELGPTRYLLHDQMCIRRDLELKNRKKMKIACSHYLPVDSDTFEVEAPVPCVVYLHGNSGSRMDADDLVDFYLEHKISVFSLDFSGCGLSEGEYVTLGHREKEDLHMVLDYLTDLKCISHIGLYGRSMGAATALLVAADDKYYHRIRGMVLDSCYTSVRQVLQELAKKYVGKVAPQALQHAPQHAPAASALATEHAHAPAQTPQTPAQTPQTPRRSRWCPSRP